MQIINGSKMIKKIIFYLVIISSSLFAQISDFEVMPNQINFMNRFERIKRVRMMNRGVNDVIIDSISYNSSILYIRNNNFSKFPLILEPDSAISIDVIFKNYINLSVIDSTTTISIYFNGDNNPRNITASVHFRLLNDMFGKIMGSVKDSVISLPDTKIYFFFAGIYLVDSTTTDNNGNYEKQLRSGNYFVAARKEGYYMQYENQKNSNLEANFIKVRKDTTQIVDFILDAEMETNFSISGVIYDILTNVVLNKAIVVVRKGDHEPTKIQASSLVNLTRDYSVMTNSKGEFNINNIQVGGNYYIQAFSQFYIPGYYNNINNHEINWQNANPIRVFGGEIEKNIYLDRDSSFGGGVAIGNVRQNIIQVDSSNKSLIYAISTSNNKAYNYSFSNSSGEFGLRDLPYGNYKLVTDKIGFNSSTSNNFYINSAQDSVANIDLLLLPTSVEHFNQIVSKFTLSQNYPNPFNPYTQIDFAMTNDDYITLTIYNLLGQIVSEIVNGYFSAGIYKVIFDASQLSSGIYIYQLKSSSNMIAKKMELLK